MAHVFLGVLILTLADGLNKLGEHNAPWGSMVNASTGKKSEELLPDIESLLPSSEFANMKSKVVELEEHLAKHQQQSNRALEELKKNYEQQLILKERENEMSKRTNAKLLARLEKLREAKAALRQNAAGFAEANAILHGELIALNANLSLAQEFVQEGIAAHQENSSELLVLAELAGEDRAADEVARKQALIGRFHDKDGISLLQTKNSGQERSPEDIVGNLAESLAVLSTEEKSRMDVLSEAFENQLASANRTHVDLLKEQASLDAAIVEAEALNERIARAVNSLSNAHDHLLARLKGARSFVDHLGKRGETTQAKYVVPRQRVVESERVTRSRNTSEVVGASAERNRTPQRTAAYHKRKQKELLHQNHTSSRRTKTSNASKKKPSTKMTPAESVSSETAPTTARKRTLTSLLPSIFR
jgi:hypothetical protein